MKKLILIFCMALLHAAAFCQSFLTVKELLSLQNALHQKKVNAGQTILQNKGYTKIYERGKHDSYFYKNCKLVVPDDRVSELNGVSVEATPKNGNATFIRVYHIPEDNYGAITVTVYGKENALKWIGQLKELGYRDNGEGGQGPRGRDWFYEKAGYPSISLWNDNGPTYVLGVDL